jgi:hypothetical protein
MLSLITDNKLASAGAAASIVGVILLVSASTLPKLDKDGNDNASKKTLNAIGGSLLALGIVVGLFDQYTRRFGGGSLSSFDMSSSEMSSADLESFQERVAAAASSLRRSMEDSSSSGMSNKSHYGEESSAELAARASAQISSFIQNYS